MNLSEERVTSLQNLLRSQYGIELTDTQARDAGLSIMRFVLAKFSIQYELTNKDNEDAAT